MEYYQQTVEQAFAAQASGPDGLSARQAAARLARTGPNELRKAKKESVFQRFLQQMADPMILVLLAAAALSALTAACAGESFADVFIILAVVLFPLWIGLAGTIFGILMGVVGAAIGFFFGGVGTVVGIVAVLVANTPAAFAAGWPTGLFMVGMCLLALALGIALIAEAVWLVTWLLPACWRLTKRAWRALTGKKEAK